MLQTTSTTDAHPFDRLRFHIPPESRLTFFSATIAFFLTHLTSFTNLQASTDSVPLYYDQLPSLWSGATSGRWLRELAEEIASPFRMPVVCGVLNMLLIALIAALIVQILRIRSKTGSILTGISLASFPAIVAFNLLFSISYLLSALFATYALYLLVCSRKRWFIAAVPLFLSISILPNHLSFYIMLAVMYLIRELLSGSYQTGNAFWRQLLQFILPVATASILLFAVTKVFIHFWGVLDYQGAGEVTSIASLLYSLPGNFEAALQKFGLLALPLSETIPVFRITLVISYALDIVFTLYLFMIHQHPFKASNLLMLIALFLIIPFAMCMMTLISRDFAYRGQHRLVWSLMAVLTIMLGEMAAQKLEHSGRKRLTRFAAILCSTTIALMSYGQFLFCNMCYQDTQYVMYKDASLMTRIVSTLEAQEGFTFESPVWFVRQYAEPDAGTSPFLLDPELYKNMISAGESLFVYFPNRDILGYLKNFMGVVLSEPSQALQDEIQASHILDEAKVLRSGEFQILRYKQVFIVLHRTAVPYFVGYSK